MQARTLRPLAARDRHTASIRPGRRYVVRLIAAIAPLLAATVAACNSPTAPLACDPPVSNFNLQGTWKGSAPHVTLTMVLGRQQTVILDQKAFLGALFVCGGTINSGSYADSTIDAHGEFAPAPQNVQQAVGVYSLLGGGSEAVLDMIPYDVSLDAVDFQGVVSDTTKNVITGTLIIQRTYVFQPSPGQVLRDSVAITMVRQ